MFTVNLHCIPCQNGATCEQTAISARCHCAEGYFGDGCGELSRQANFDLFLWGSLMVQFPTGNRLMCVKFTFHAF